MKTNVLVGAAILAATLSIPAVALAADVHREGSFAGDPPVSLDLDRVARRVALQELAKAAGWSLVLPTEPSGDAVTLHVQNQDPGVLLDAILAGDATVPAYRVRRDKSLVIVDREFEGRRDRPRPPTPPAAAGEARDRTVTGGSIVIAEDETAHDVTVMGGKADVLGTVTGDLTVFGGKAEVHPGAVVAGDATAIGGKLTIDDGAEVRGHSGVVGGVLNRAAGSHSHGIDDVEVSSLLAGPRRLMGGVGRALSSAALLFVFGAILFALAPDRMERLQAELAARPMRSFALGVLTFLGLVAAVAALCVTIIGIPVAIVLVLASVFAGYAGACGVLATGGRAVLGHRTRNPYVHLAFGAVVFLAVSALPWVGDVVTLVTIALSLGALFATKGGRADVPSGSGYRVPA